MTYFDLLTKLGIEWSSTGPHSRQGWVQLKQCPYCYSTNYHLGLNLSGGYLNCFRCGRHDLVGTLGLLSKQPPAAIRSILPANRFRPVKAVQLRPIEVELPPHTALKSPHREYLRRRGFNPTILAGQWDLRGIGPLGGSLSWRILIPIQMHGRLVSWTSRSIGKAKPKYLTASDQQSALPRNELLYGFDHVPGHVVYLVEGPADVWAVGPGAVCAMGLEVSRYQIHLLSQFPRRVIVFDPETAAQKRAAKIARQLSAFKGETYQIELETGDPGEADKEELAELRKFDE